MATKAKSGTKIVWFETLRSPKGTALFNYLREPDEKYKPTQRIQIMVDQKDPEFKPFCQAMVAAKEKFMKSLGQKSDGKIPGLQKADAYMAEKFADKGVKEGSLYFEFRTNARQDDAGEWIFVPIYSSENKLSDTLRVFSGDVIRAAVRLGGYDTGKEKGLKPYLNAVQMIVKKSSAGATNPFENEAGAGETTEPEAEQPPFEAEAKADKKSAKKGTKPEAPKAEPEVETPADASEVNLDDLA